MLNLVQHLINSTCYETLKRVQGDISEVLGQSHTSHFLLWKELSKLTIERVTPVPPLLILNSQRLRRNPKFLLSQKNVYSRSDPNFLVFTHEIT
jgi:hypothetical protein